MGVKVKVFLLFVYLQFLIIAAETNNADFVILKALKETWENEPPNWKNNDPCGDSWEGIICTSSRVTSITLSSVGLKGQLSEDITGLSELHTLDLSYNRDLRGPLPTAIGKLYKLSNLILVGCSFSGPIPDSIGSLQELTILSINYNGFSGKIPPSIGRLSNLFWLDLADNQLEGEIPVSNENSPGLDMLVHTKHFHLGHNKLSGSIPEKLFRPDMVLIHVLFDNNNLSGNLPSTLGLVKTLEVIRFDRNSLSGPVPSNLNNLTSVDQLLLSNNQLTGPIPNLTGLNLSYLDMSNNSFDVPDVPSWFSSIKSLTALMMENTKLKGQVPADLFSLPNLKTVVMKRNELNGTLDLGTSYNDHLLIDLQSNRISEYTPTDRPGAPSVDLILVDNPICQESGNINGYCSLSQGSFHYSTKPKNCSRVPCSSDQISSATCQCAYPYTGTLVFRVPLSDLGNSTYYETLEQNMTQSFQFSYKLPVDSIFLSDPRKNIRGYLELNLQVFPFGQERFNRTGVSSVGFVLSYQTYWPPSLFGSYYFIGDQYKHFAGESGGSNKPTGVIIGAAAGCCVLLSLLLLAGVYAYRQKRRAEKANEYNPFAHWEMNKSSDGIPQLKGARCFSFEEVKKYTNNFSEANNIGCGGYGKVYKGILPNGQLIAIKRAQQGSRQGGQEFKMEIELLSRVHHKNLVSLLGFCFERGEQMLIYEFVPNGSLGDSLSGKTEIRLDWIRRLKIALDTARGLVYLHELANPPIIHRDIKSANILLDERLTAKVADFGLSKSLSDSEKAHISTQVKGTMGYLDPEYYMTQKLTEKSDVYSFGALMLELITGRRPLNRGKYIVREIRMAMDKQKELYNLYELIDPIIGLSTTLKGFERYVDLALRCVQESGDDRPTMNEAVKEIENILNQDGLNSIAESASSSTSYEDASKGIFHHPHSKEGFDYGYSGGFPLSKIEPQ